MWRAPDDSSGQKGDAVLRTGIRTCLGLELVSGDISLTGALLWWGMTEDIGGRPFGCLALLLPYGARGGVSCYHHDPVANLVIVIGRSLESACGVFVTACR